MKQVSKKTVILWIVYGVLVVATILAFVFSPQIYGVKSGIDSTGAVIWNPRSVFDVDIANPVLKYLVSQAVPNLIHTVQIVGVAVTLAILLHLLAKITFHTKKTITISKLIVNFLKWVIAIASVFFILDAWGADTTMMITSAGVVTLIIGLGSQSLVADILAGVFIVFEGDFQVGDIVIIDGWRGEVMGIGIRTTKLQDAGGNVKIVNNSEIKTLVNQTKELSVAKAYVSISYNERIEHVENVVAKNLDKIKETIPAIVEGPFYKGVSELGASGVELLFVAKCKEDDIYQVQRDMNRIIKIIFDDNNIEIPFNQIVVHDAAEEEKSALSRREEKKAGEFVAEQQELSKDIIDK